MREKLPGAASAVIVIGVVMFMAVGGVCAQTVNTPFDFPVKPGTPQWAEFKSHSEMIQACQIPEDLLTRMDTKALLTTCLDYPLYSDIYAYNNFQDGFDAVRSSFNGLSELLKRRDLAPHLISAYEARDPQTTQSGAIMKQSMRHMNIEMIIAQSEVVNALDARSQHRVLREQKKKFTEKTARPDLFSVFSFTPGCLAMGKIVKNSFDRHLTVSTAKMSDAVLSFLGNPENATPDVCNEIATIVDTVLK